MKKLKKKLITFEGPEGSGKSTHIKFLNDYLKNKGCKVEVLREPGATVIGEEIRKILLAPELDKMSPLCELYLYLACRAQLIEEKIIPFLKEDKIILCDRFSDATLAYQGYGSGLPIDLIMNLETYYSYPVKPDLTILLDINVELGLKRASRHRKQDRLEKKDIAYHERVRQGYLLLAKKDPERIKVVSSELPIEVVRTKIVELIENVLK